MVAIEIYKHIFNSSTNIDSRNNKKVRRAEIFRPREISAVGFLEFVAYGANFYKIFLH